MGSNTVLGKPFSNPWRAAAAIGTAGTSEMYLQSAEYAGKKIKEGITPDLPKTPELDLPPSPTSEDPAVKAKTQAKLSSAQAVEMEPKSRSATVYAGKNSTLNSAPKVSRRTLMGA